MVQCPVCNAYLQTSEGMFPRHIRSQISDTAGLLCEGSYQPVTDEAPNMVIEALKEVLPLTHALARAFNHHGLCNSVLRGTYSMSGEELHALCDCGVRQAQEWYAKHIKMLMKLGLA